jgi:hypothetical protein
MVLPDRPTARGAATSWRVYRFQVSRDAWVLPLVGIDIICVAIEQRIE